MYDAVLDTGASDSIVASSLVSDLNRRGYCAVKVGDGHYTHSEGKESVDVCMGHFNLPHVCIVMETSAFQVCLGMNFIRQNAKTILSLISTPSRLIVKIPETDELSLVSLSEKSCQKEGGNILPPVQSSLRISRREAYSLLPSLREQVLIDLGDLRPTVDLYANPKNHTEPLYCSLLNSCYAWNWHDFQLCWANPPWSHLQKMVTKAVLDRAQVVVICPDWGRTGEAAAWRPLLDRMTKVRVPIPDVPLYVPDGATSPLPAPRWRSIASLIDGNDCGISLDALNFQVVKFLHRVNRDLTWSDLLKRYGHDTPATTPKDESEFPEIHPPTESDEEHPLPQAGRDDSGPERGHRSPEQLGLYTTGFPTPAETRPNRRGAEDAPQQREHDASGPGADAEMTETSGPQESGDSLPTAAACSMPQQRAPSTGNVPRGHPGTAPGHPSPTGATPDQDRETMPPPPPRPSQRRNTGPFDDAELRALYGIHATTASSKRLPALREHLQDIYPSRLFAVVLLPHAAITEIFVRQLQALVTPGTQITDDLVDAWIWWFNTHELDQGGIWVPHLGWAHTLIAPPTDLNPRPAPGAGSGPPRDREPKAFASHRTKAWRNGKTGQPSTGGVTSRAW